MTTPEKMRRTVKVSRKIVPKTHIARTIQVRAKQTRAAELRAAGVTYDKIAQELGYSHASSAKKAVDAFLQDQQRELAKDIIMMDLVRLDEMQMRATAALRQGDLKQIPVILQVMQQRYSLVGISSRTVAELQEKYGINPQGPGVGGVTNNGVMVIGGSEGDFVRSMMIATGNDPDSPEVIAQVKAIETARTVREERAGMRKLEKTATENTHGGVLEEAEVVDAEIVEE